MKKWYKVHSRAQKSKIFLINTIILNFYYPNFHNISPLLLCSLIGKVVLKGRRLTGTLEDEEEHDSDTDSDDDSEIGIHLLNYNPVGLFCV